MYFLFGSEEQEIKIRIKEIGNPTIMELTSILEGIHELHSVSCQIELLEKNKWYGNLNEEYGLRIKSIRKASPTEILFVGHIGLKILKLILLTALIANDNEERTKKIIEVITNKISNERHRDIIISKTIKGLKKIGASATSSLAVLEIIDEIK